LKKKIEKRSLESEKEPVEKRRENHVRKPSSNRTQSEEEEKETLLIRNGGGKVSHGKTTLVQKK